MAARKPAKKSPTASEPAASTAAGDPTGTPAVGAAAKSGKAGSKATKTPKRGAASKNAPESAPPRGKRPSARTADEGPPEFVVQVGDDMLTLKYGEVELRGLEMVLFVSNEDQKKRAEECIEALGMHELIVRLAKTYFRP